MTQQRRVPDERNANLEEVAKYLNITIDMLIGNKKGRVALLDDDGLLRDIRGGATLGTAEPSLKVRSAAGEHVLVEHSSGSPTLFEVQDAGVTLGTVVNAVTFDDAVEFRETVTIRNGTSTTVLAFFDPANAKAVFGRSAALTSAPNDLAQFIGGRVYFSPSSSDQAIGLRFNATAGNFYLGASDATAPDLVARRNDGTQTFRSPNALGLIVGTATSMAGTELVRVQGGLRAEGATTVTTGGLTVTAGGLTVTAGGATITAGGLTLTAAPLIIGSTVAASGDVRVTNTFALRARNAGNNADMDLVSINSGSNVVFGDLGLTSTNAYLAGTSTANFYVNGTVRIAANTTGVAFNGGTGIAVQSIGPTATDLTSIITLGNNIRSALRAYTLCN